MFNGNFTRVFVSAVGALVLSSTCVLASVGPVRAAAPLAQTAQLQATTLVA